MTGLSRIGIGHDTHRLADGGPLRLGGIAVPHTKHALGHSDADVLLHAITDALLGAAACGDIGQMFPDTDPANRGRDSSDMLARAWQTVAALGWKIVNLDCIVFAEQPKLGPHRGAIQRRIAAIVGIEPDQVGIKAKTGEGSGSIGRQETIAAQCVVLLQAVPPVAPLAASTSSESQPAMIRVYNTLTKNKEPFQTVQPGKVGMYLCGPTVYKPSHIGHMVGPVIFDAIKRYLLYSGYDVTWVVNVTDVDDKLIAEANKRGVPMAQLAAEMTADYMRNLEAMGIDTISHFPRATDFIPQMIEFIERLIVQGFAYAADGDVYFDVARFHEYGKLSHRSLEQMQIEGGTTAERKRSGADFALWKSAKAGEPSWPSPWGPGRPGWHIECSVMSGKLLGETFDIHGGGLDLVFPHHENEIAQSEACHGKPMARYWMHNGLMQASDELGKVGGRQTRPAEGDKEAQEVHKISKSRGASPFSELLRDHQPETIRFFLLSTHYRRPIDYSEERIREVGAGLATFYRFFKRYKLVTGEDFYALPYPSRRPEGDFEPGQDALLKEVAEQRTRFLEAMDDDFNTGGAIGVLFELLRKLNKFVDDEKLEDPVKRDAAKAASLKQGTRALRELAATMGLFRKPVAEAAPGGDDALLGKLMALLIEVRAEARKAKNFAMADKIRNRLTEIGIVLEDRPGGTDWSKK